MEDQQNDAVKKEDEHEDEEKNFGNNKRNKEGDTSGQGGQD